MTTELYRERQLWSGDENVKIRYVIGSSVAGTSASSPSVPRRMQLQVLKWLNCEKESSETTLAQKIVFANT